MKKGYKSTIGMLKGIGMPKKFVKKVDVAIKERSIPHELSAFRFQMGFTEAAVAKKLKWRLQKVRKVEATKNRDHRLGNLYDYAGAIGFTVEVCIRQK